MSIKKSTWDDIANKVISFLKYHWWKFALILISVGIAISSFSIKIGNAEIKKGQVPLDQIKRK